LIIEIYNHILGRLKLGNAYPKKKQYPGSLSQFQIRYLVNVTLESEVLMNMEQPSVAPASPTLVRESCYQHCQ
jgi:hypothetical protein